LRLLAPILALLALAPAAHAGTPAPGFNDQLVTSGLTQPTAIAFLPGGRLLVTEKGGRLVLVKGATTATLTNIPVCTASEMGLLGIALDPNFATNRFVYLYRTKPGSAGCGSSTGRFNQVVRVKMVGDSVQTGSLTQLLSGIRTVNGNHDGGALRIGPDKKLYVGVGDAGLGDVNGSPGSSTNPYSQDLSALEGKLLRLELDGTPAAGNPFIGQPGARGEIFARGFRNPWRFGFDRQTGALWLGDVGQNTIEEVDIVTAGGNYAWPRCEGTLPVGCQQPGDIAPIFSYPHQGTGALGEAITGGEFAGAGFGSFQGDYFFGDYVASKLYRITPNAARNGVTGAPSEFVTNAAGPVDIVFGPTGALYYAAINSGEIRRVLPARSCGGLAATIVGSAGNDNLSGSPGDDVIVGLGGNDTIDGLGGNDTICGGDGADTLDGGAGADVLLGGTGTDTATYATRTAGIHVSIDNVANDGNSTDGPAGARDNVRADVENLIGGGGGDTLTGSAAVNRLTGGPRADSLFGVGGNDILFANDGTADTKIDCDGGTADAAHVDSQDPATVGCESVGP
jgi:glucose/arabinose dehydrogenase